MPQTNQYKTNNEDIKIENKNSSLSEFVNRKVSNNENIEKFEQYVTDEIKDGEIEESLAEIYKTEDGDKVDITKLEKKKGSTILSLFFFLSFILLFLIGATWGYYVFLYPKEEQLTTGVDLLISGPQEINEGEDFIYTISYTNPTKIEIKNVEIKIIYPDNFIFTDSYPPIVDNDKTIWNIEKINAFSGGNIKIKGKLVGKEKDKNIILINMSWNQVDSAAEFRKESALETIVNKTGLNFEFSPPANILVNDTANIFIKYAPKDNNFLKNFRLKIDELENIEFISASIKDGKDINVKDDIKNGILQINEIDNNEHEIDIAFKVTKKINEIEKMELHFEYLDDNGIYYSFFDKIIEFSVIKNDLNLSLILNGSSNNKGVNFGETLNYSIAFSNSGDSDLGNVAIMAILDSDVLDLSTLKASHDGAIKRNTISWSHREASQLKALEKGDNGMMNFSVNILPFDEIKDKNINYQVSSYAQFGIGISATTTELTLDETRSNTIIAQVNSNLELDEKIRYFNDDNIAVGLGPLPPKIGESTSYRVYWKITNSLNELKDLVVKTKLPKYVYWVSSLSPTIGKLDYDNATHEVIWDIGDLEISEIIGNVEFNIKVTPTEEDKDKVLALLSGTIAEASDTQTNSKINLTKKASTTMLENDEIGMSDGIIRSNED